MECTQELVAYRRLVVECARQLWYRENPKGACLPKGFAEGFRLEFDRIEPGSAVVPVCRVHEGTQAWSEVGDHFDQGALLIQDMLRAAEREEPFPSEFPRVRNAAFRELGRSLHSDEMLFIKARGSDAETPYSSKVCDRLLAKIARDYTGPALWEQLVAIGERASPGTWDNVPADLSMRGGNYHVDEREDDE